MIQSANRFHCIFFAMDVRDWQQLEDAMLAGQVARPARQSALRNPSSGSVGTPQSHGQASSPSAATQSHSPSSLGSYFASFKSSATSAAAVKFGKEAPKNTKKSEQEDDKGKEKNEKGEDIRKSLETQLAQVAAKSEAAKSKAKPDKLKRPAAAPKVLGSAKKKAQTGDECNQPDDSESEAEKESQKKKKAHKKPGVGQKDQVQKKPSAGPKAVPVKRPQEEKEAQPKKKVSKKSKTSSGSAAEVVPDEKPQENDQEEDAEEEGKTEDPVCDPNQEQERFDVGSLKLNGTIQQQKTQFSKKAQEWYVKQGYPRAEAYKLATADWMKSPQRSALISFMPVHEQVRRRFRKPDTDVPAAPAEDSPDTPAAPDAPAPDAPEEGGPGAFDVD